MNKKIIITSVIVVIIAILVFLRIFGQSATLSQPVNSTSSQSATSLIQGWKSCDYSSFGFKFQYPSAWNVYVYSAHQGAGNTPVQVNCGDMDASQLDSIITIAPSPEWNSLTTIGGMQIQTWYSPNNPKTLTAVPAGVVQHEEYNHPVISTSTIDGKDAVVLRDGIVIVGPIMISFNNNTASSVRANILQTFHFLAFP